MKKNNKKGFTLVELVIVVAVMAILVAIAIPTVGSITKSAKDAVYSTNCQTIQSMIKLAEANKSKDADGVAAMAASDVETALNEAKLGIKASGKTGDTSNIFYYHPGVGTVDASSAAIDSETVIKITFDAKGVAKCE